VEKGDVEAALVRRFARRAGSFAERLRRFHLLTQRGDLNASLPPASQASLTGRHFFQPFGLLRISGRIVRQAPLLVVPTAIAVVYSQISDAASGALGIGVSAFDADYLFHRALGDLLTAVGRAPIVIALFLALRYFCGAYLSLVLMANARNAAETARGRARSAWPSFGSTFLMISVLVCFDSLFLLVATLLLLLGKRLALGHENIALVVLLPIGGAVFVMCYAASAMFAAILVVTRSQRRRRVLLVRASRTDKLLRLYQLYLCRFLVESAFIGIGVSISHLIGSSAGLGLRVLTVAVFAALPLSFIRVSAFLVKIELLGLGWRYGASR
jgi:hypothetical protein